jgi:hypothetical protein
MDDSHIWYKIVEKENGTVRTLFHGVNRSRVIEPGKWLEAEEKMVTDGSCQSRYLYGWHVIETLDAAQKYLTKFTKRVELLRIIPCEARDVRPKEHSPAPVFLARWIKI